ncbi:MAG TPA: glycogen debranching protein GlgX [Solirubrobacteraceae bacterium]|nr:glycogen debranching protein GlgX [Solirubrobacteraceae bacterium]
MSVSAARPSGRRRGRPRADILPGRPFPQGATWDGLGTNFSLWSERAERVDLCLFDEDGGERRIEVCDQTAFQWHVYLPGIGPGQRYGYRVHGPYEPEQGLRFNPDKLLIDPYAKAIDGAVDWRAANTLPYEPGGGDDADLTIDSTDDAAAIPKGVVIDPSFPWGEDRVIGRRWSSTVIYETHVKGFTMRHADVPENLRGTYAGLASEASIDYLRGLGITAVELLPVHHIADESFLIDKGLSNYWGYSSIGYFAPHAAYSSSGTRGEQVREFKAMVKALHAAGIEVILDVVFNHTAEGNHLGPMLSFKGIDNPGYYRLSPEDPRYYMDFTGTGNSLNSVNPSVLRMIMDSLRYWVIECHVDGFRFDLAATLARELYDVDRLSSFFDVIHQDPFLSQVKLIAEPWDVGPGGYQVGNFPILWTEWNGEYRDAIRDFWRGETAVAEFAQRFTGSADLYQDDGRRPAASINFVTAHDGFTLADLVSYNEKHNEANLEDNRDGTDNNRSWNCGAEGPTDDPAIRALRARQQRNFLVTLMLSQGVPMLLGGDEFGRSQGGNNNAWCQDNEISWFDWESADHELQEFARRVIALRQSEPVFRRRDFFVGDEVSGSGLPDVVWLRPDGEEMTQEDWERGDAHALGVFLNGQEIATQDRDGHPIRGSSFLIFFNAHYEPITFTIPREELGERWALELSTDPDRDGAAAAGRPEGDPAGDGAQAAGALEPGATFEVRDRSLTVLRRVRRAEP